jgi:hypothetical protein
MDGKSWRETAEYLSSLAGSNPVVQVRPSAPPANPFRPFTRRLPLSPDAPLLRQKKIRPETARRFETGSWAGNGFLKNCVGVRLHDTSGHPVGYAGRRIHPADIRRYGKWKFPSGLPKSGLLYNWHRCGSAMKKGLVVVECPWGVMRLSQAGIPAVALLGIHLSPVQFELLRKVPRILLMPDGDTAGRNAFRHIGNCLDSHTRVRTILLPEGLDPDDLDDLELKKFSSSFLS